MEIVIAGGGGGFGFIFIGGTLPGATVGNPYTASVQAAGGGAVQPITYTVTSGSLPPGLAMSSGGAITGTPTTGGAYTFTVKAQDSSDLQAHATFQLAVSTQPFILTASLPNGTVGVNYTGDISAVAPQPPITYSVIGGSLPPGVALASTGGLSGVPTAVGMFQFVVQISDSADPQNTAQGTFSIQIVASQVQTPVAKVDAALIFAGSDGGVYCVEEGQYHDNDIEGDANGYMSQWQGVPTPGPTLAEMQLGGATVAAIGSGQMNINAVDDAGTAYGVSTANRPFQFKADGNGNPIETILDFVARGLPHRTKWGVSIDNGGVADAWFELHSVIFYERPMFSARRG